ncbi:MAG: DMT family transporter [Verrucomicrobiales bacterium]|nr:DMT family transporter [Verrucomicrobiota bacterium JB025]
MTSPPSPSKSIGLMLGSVLLFSVNALLVRGLNLHAPQVDGWIASLYRGIVGLVIVIAFFGFGRGLELKHLVTNPLLFFRGLLGGFGILAFYISLVHLGAAKAVIINLSYPIFGSLFATLWLKEHLPARSWIWMVAGFCGLVIFLGSDLHNGITRYDWLALAGAIAAGGIITLIRQLRNQEHTATIYASQCAASVAFAILPTTGTALHLPPDTTLLLVLAAVVVAIAQLAMTHAYRTLSVARGSSIQMLLPLVTAAGGWLLFDESFNAIGISGAALTMLATWRVVAR